VALTAADKRWIRNAVREILAEVIEAEAAAQLGGYDGATPADEGDFEQGRKIGFTPPKSKDVS